MFTKTAIPRSGSFRVEIVSVGLDCILGSLSSSVRYRTNEAPASRKDEPAELISAPQSHAPASPANKKDQQPCLTDDVLGLPWGVDPEHGVKNSERFGDARDEHHLAWFAVRAKSCIEPAQGRVAADGT